MATKPITISSPDRILNMVQDNMARVLNPVLSNPIIDGSLLTRIELGSGLNIVNHKLGRKPLGFIITRISADENVWDTQDDNTTPQLNYFLNASGAVTVDIYFF